MNIEESFHAYNEKSHILILHAYFEPKSKVEALKTEI